MRSKAKTYSLRIAFLTDLSSVMFFSLFWITDVLIATLSSGAGIFYFRGRVWRPLSLTEPPYLSAETSFHFKMFGKAFQWGQPTWRDKQSKAWDRLVSLKYFLSYDQLQPHAIESLTLRSSGTFPTTQGAEREKSFDRKTKAWALSVKPPWLNYLGLHCVLPGDECFSVRWIVPSYIVETLRNHQKQEMSITRPFAISNRTNLR